MAGIFNPIQDIHRLRTENASLTQAVAELRDACEKVDMWWEFCEKDDQVVLEVIQRVKNALAKYPAEPKP